MWMQLTKVMQRTSRDTLVRRLSLSVHLYTWLDAMHAHMHIYDRVDSVYT